MEEIILSFLAQHAMTAYLTIVALLGAAAALLGWV